MKRLVETGRIWIDTAMLEGVAALEGVVASVGSGRILADLAAAENLDAAWTWCEVETRSCIILVDPAARRTTVINEAGPRLQPGDWNRVSAEVLARASEARAVCLSGSLPPGVAADGLAELCRSLVRSGRAPWVDSSGEALAAAPQKRSNRFEINLRLARSGHSVQ